MNTIVLDVDTGEDDALALLLALGMGLPLAAVVTSYGNTTLSHATENTCNLLGLAERSDIPVFVGSAAPLEAHPIESVVSAGAFVGTNGLCDVVIPPARNPTIVGEDLEFDTEQLLRFLTSHAPVDYIVTGPCTNLARLLRSHPDTVTHAIRRVYIMGGAFTLPGNSGPIRPDTGAQDAEFNMYCDALAAREVLGSGMPIYCVPWDVTHDCTISARRVRTLTGSSDTSRFVVTLMNAFLTRYGLSHDRAFECNDPLTVMAWVGYGSFTKVHAGVSAKIDSYGKSTIDPSGFPLWLYHLSEQEKQDIVTRILSELGIVETKENTQK